MFRAGSSWARAGFRFRHILAGLLFCVLSLVMVLQGCRAPGPRGRTSRLSDGTIRAIWVTRWDYKKPRDIAAIMNNCRKAGFNTVLFQVRGNGTVFYRSRIEPWADELGGRDPGFDPLAVAISEARRRGLQLHAWVNVIPGWRGDKPPKNGRQLYHARPDWFWRDAQGRRQPLGWYVSLNPCYPEVRDYLVAVLREIVANYDVDGLHLDYIRFPNEWNDSYPRGARVPDYPRDARTLAMFHDETGQTPESSSSRWDQWRREKLTQLVADIRAMVAETNRRVRLSAAVGADVEAARRKYFQDVRSWLDLRLLDAVYPMNYEKDPASFVHRLNAWSARYFGVPVVMGIMLDQRPSSLVVEQLDRSRRMTPHFCAFAYNSLFERLDGRGRPDRDAQSRSRAELRRRVIPHIRRLAK